MSTTHSEQLMASTDDAIASARRELMDLEHRSHDAMLNRDVAFLDRLLADDFIFTDPGGRRWDKAEWIADVTGGAATIEAISTNDLLIRVYGDAAVINGRVTMTMHAGGQSQMEQYSYTAVYVRQAGQWRCVSDHAGFLGE